MCSLKNMLHYIIYIGVARANERVSEECSAPRRLCCVAEISVAERITRRNYRHRIPVFSCKFTPLQPRSCSPSSFPTTRFSPLPPCSQLASRRSFLVVVASFVCCWSVRTVGELVFDAAFLRPFYAAGQVRDQRNMREQRNFFYDFSRFFNTEREMRLLLIRMLNWTYFECELSFTTPQLERTIQVLITNLIYTHAEEILT